MRPEITEELLPALEGALPSMIASGSPDGIPNVAGISQVFYVDAHHVAISRQFFNKTVQNIEHNPWVRVTLTCPQTYSISKLLLRFVDSQSSGPVYEQMTIQLEAIANMQGKAGVFHLQAADVYEVVEIEKVYAGV